MYAKFFSKLWANQGRELRCNRPLPLPARCLQEQRIQRWHVLMLSIKDCDPRVMVPLISMVVETYTE